MEIDRSLAILDHIHALLLISVASSWIFGTQLFCILLFSAKILLMSKLQAIIIMSCLELVTLVIVLSCQL